MILQALFVRAHDAIVCPFALRPGNCALILTNRSLNEDRTRRTCLPHNLRLFEYREVSGFPL
jgi:hypothetical protein